MTNPSTTTFPQHRKLLLVQNDGNTIDLLKVHRLAEDCIRNWHKGDKLNMPHFVGDFKRLTPLAKALNGKRYALPSPSLRARQANGEGE